MSTTWAPSSTRSWHLALVFAAGLAGCGKRGGGDDCQRVADRTWPLIAEAAKASGRQVTDADMTKMVEGCRRGLEGGHRDPTMDCVLAATDDAAVRACMTKGMANYAAKSKAINGQSTLDTLQRQLERAVAERGSFPAGKTGPTPATPCCTQPDQKCPVNAADWAQPVWQALGFEPFSPGRFQYSYESDGKAVTVTAMGDMNCDGHALTLSLKGRVVDGKPVFDPRD